MAAFFWYIQFQIDKNPEPFSWIDLLRKFGREYQNYRDEVPSFIPFLK